MLDNIVARDSLSDVTEQDLKLLWDYRFVAQLINTIILYEYYTYCSYH